MKSIKVLLLSAAIAVTAAACSSSSPGSSVDTSATESQVGAPAAGTDAVGTMQQ